MQNMSNILSNRTHIEIFIINYQQFNKTDTVLFWHQF